MMWHHPPPLPLQVYSADEVFVTGTFGGCPAADSATALLSSLQPQQALSRAVLQGSRSATLLPPHINFQQPLMMIWWLTK